MTHADAICSVESLVTRLADAIAADCAAQGHLLLGRLPFDPVVTRAMVQRQALTEFDNPLGALLKDMWSALQDFPAGKKQG